jgi:hypothetical protein
MKNGKITKDIKILWHSGYYDGVLSGVCDYQGKKHWFSLSKDGSERIYEVYSISKENEEILLFWHKLFIETVNPNIVYEYNETRDKLVRADKEFIHDPNFAKDFFWERYILFTQKIGGWSNLLELEKNKVGTVSERTLLCYKEAKNDL